MAYICSIGKSIPAHPINQDEVKELVQHVFGYSNREVKKLLPVFDHAKVENRQLVVDKGWFKETHTFEAKNQLYQEKAITHSIEAMDHCLENEQLLHEPVPYEAIDLLIYVSSSGITAPSIDAFLLNERPFRQDVERMPLWGLGCAGGAIGLSRAFDWLKANPDKTALVVCCELCSITFQKSDHRKSNIVGTAFFGDGISVALLAGENSPYLNDRKHPGPRIIDKSSRIKENSTSVMGWDVTNQGLNVIFSKSIPALVGTFWKEHIELFFKQIHHTADDITAYVAHPGGLKVLQAMEDVLMDNPEKLKHSYHVLRDHGNMSSATVFYCLEKWMIERLDTGEKGILSALGPGFSSELLLLEWVD